MAKPIFLVGLPKQATYEAYHSGMKAIKDELQGDYYVFGYPNYKDTFTFQVLNADDLTPLQYEELKKIVEQTIALPTGGLLEDLE